MPNTDDNPYASPRAGSTPNHPSERRASRWLALLASLVAGAAAFALVAAPLAVVMVPWDLPPGSEPSSTEDSLTILWFVGAILITSGAAHATWFYLRPLPKPKIRAEECGDD